MATITFDTLAYAKKLKAAGVPEAQADIQAETQRETIEIVVSELEARHLKDLANKGDVQAVRSDVSGIRSDLKDLATKDSLRKVEVELAVVKWMLGTVIAGIAALIMKAFFA